MTPLQAAPPGGDGALAGLARPMRRPSGSRLADRVYLIGCGLAAFVGLVAIAYLVARTMAGTRPALGQIGLWEFISGTEWAPANGQYGAFPALYGTLVTSVIAMAIAVPLAVGVALGTTVLLPKRLRGPVASMIDTLAAIPSVVYGLWGVIVLVPLVKPVFTWIADHNGPIGAFEGPVLGQSLFLAAIVLAVMILPIIAAVVREVFATIPSEQSEAALALGATRWEMIRGAMLPWARSGIVGASALGLGRAVGETIAVAMILGSQPRIFESLFGPGQTLAGTIAFEYNSAIDGIHTSALVAMAVALFVVAFVVNLLARLLVTRRAGKRASRWSLRRTATAVGERLVQHRPRRSRGIGRSPLEPRVTARGSTRISVGRRIRSRVAETAIALSLIVALVPLVLVIGYAVAKGNGALSIDFLTSDGEPDIVGNGISHALVGTLIMLGIATVVAVPLGLFAALFLREANAHGRVWQRIAAAIGVVIDVLLGVPSIVAGLIIAIVVVLGMGTFSALAGGLALAVIMFPIVVRSTDEVLRLVPEPQVEAALALGAPRWRVAASVVLPTAAPGILTGIMLAMARVSGETAPLILTASGAQFFSTDVFAEMTALPLYIFNGTVNSSVEVAQQHAWAAALVLVALVFFLNIVARLISRTTSNRGAR